MPEANKLVSMLSERATHLSHEEEEIDVVSPICKSQCSLNEQLTFRFALISETDRQKTRLNAPIVKHLKISWVARKVI